MNILYHTAKYFGESKNTKTYCQCL